MEKINNLNDLFLEQLKGQYDGENRQLEALTILRVKASTTPLRESIDEHVGKINNQLQRLNYIFALLNIHWNGEVNKGMKGLIDDALDRTGHIACEYVKDASIVSAIQHFNHHNMSKYGTLGTYACQLQMAEVKKLLADALEDEMITDQGLLALAEVSVHITAAQ